ncbi:hypothetical protein GCM10011390_34490 [Aureimonas endophytica]|uniref:Blue-light-activated histidine kinase n=1 Tax=Aureimonas endophytica TaxID=2027858 RepID=A0A916ZSV9_9HYPH|nr:PAS domain S-box protein [Aureimonas endophytica]GGE12441.1 hypothetical protein GCM10011390_34490 [Aureimonas endophytica]
MRETDDVVRDRDRFATLDSYRILDTPPERGFDDIVALATQICATPVALVSLVGRDRQWFKARIGFEPCETDLERSVCRHALGGTELLEIGDLTLDPRTRDNPLVTGAPHLRFYAGAPLVTRDGQVIGTLCVIDHVARPEGLSPAQRSGLKALAGQVMAQLDLRRALGERDEFMERREAEQRVALAEAARLEAMIATQQAVAVAEADLGIVFQAIADGALRVVDSADGAVIELRRGEELVYESVAGSLTPHKGLRLPMATTLSGRAVREERPLLCSDTFADPVLDQRLVRSLGIRSMITVPVTRRGEPIGVLKVQSRRPDAFSPRDVVMTQMLAGLVASAFGDVAEVRSRQALRDADRRYRQTFESITEFAVVVTDRTGIVTEWNTGAELTFGWTREEMRGQHVSRFFTPEDNAQDRPAVEMAEALSEGQAVDERWHLRSDGARFYSSGSMMPLRGESGEHLGFIKIVRDRTEQHEAGKALEASRGDLAASETKWRGLFEQLEEGFILGRVLRGEGGRIVDWVYEEVNRAWGELVGIAPERALGRTIRELIPGIEDAWVNEFADVVDTGQPIRFTRQVGTFDRWYDGVAQPLGDDRFTVLFLEVTDRVRAEEEFRRAREQLQLAVEAANIGIFDFDPVEGRLGWDARTRAFFGVPSDRPVDYVTFLDGLHPDDRARTDEVVRASLDPAGSGRYDVVFRTIGLADGVERWIAAKGQAFFAGDRAVRFVGTVRDITEERRAEEALRATEERYRLAARATNDAIWDWDLVADHVRWNEALQAAYGHPLASVEPTGEWWIAQIHPDDRARIDASIHALIEGSGTEWADEYRFARADGSYADVFDRGHVIRDEEGRPLRMIGAMLDLTRVQQAEAELRESQRQLVLERGLLAAVVEQAPLGIAIGHADGRGQINRRLEEMLGHPAGPEGDQRYAAYSAVHADGSPYRQEDYPTLRALRRGETLIDEPMTYRNPATGETRRWEVSATPVRDAQGQIIAAVSVVIDVEDRRRDEEARAILNRELSHRLKNTLAIVSSIATQTLRTAPDLTTARKTLTERIGALSKAHDLLLTGQRDAASIEEIVKATTALLDDGGRVVAGGPDIPLGPKAALTLSLILHELSTNAGKYGALSAPEGRVAIEWSLAPSPTSGSPVLRLEWRESGGPPVVPPARRSFGTRLIEMGLSGAADGRVVLDYAPDGLRCRLEAPLAELQTET